MSTHPRISKIVEKLSYHTELPFARRLHVLVFIFAYTGLGLLYATTTDDFHTLLLTIAAFVTAFLNALAFLFTYWSVSFKTFVAFKKIDSIQNATFVQVTPAAHKGSKELCKIIREEQNKGATYFVFQRRKFIYNEEKKVFQKQEFPDNLPLNFYSTQTGLSEAEVKNGIAYWGTNRFDIPLPTFGELYKEQALAPFFVFQVFCVGLWCLDEYWQYSIFTLCMLLLFEFTVVKSRIRNMQSLRQMVEKPAQNLWVYRAKSWKSLPADSLLPGDICSLTRGTANEHTTCPADVLLLSGGCVVNEAMLTGESTPHHKEALRSGDQLLDMNVDKLHVVFGGTQIVQHTPAERGQVSRAPDGGCLAFVLRTGFETSQGRLMRTILFSSERITANSVESFVFILFLLIFALAAAAYILNEGLKDETRSRYKLILNCTLVITSVVPPELPMELSLAVNTSLVALARLGIFCTEPFRIPFAGKVDVCCFDKTGTLTTDDLVLAGVASASAPQNSESEKSGSESKSSSEQTLSLSQPNALPDGVTFVLAGCHSLVYLDGQLVGDPMETATLRAIGWNCSQSDIVTPRHGNRRVSIRNLCRHHFSSSLKRMSTVSLIDINGNAEGYALVKGAPEVLRPFFAPLPPHFDNVYTHYSSKGFRVLALGYRPLPSSMIPSEMINLSRADVERDLIFAGFAIFECPLKPDSSIAIKNLLESSHRVAMITGDNVFTACEVARELTMISKPALILTEARNWTSVDQTETFDLHNDPAHLPNLAKNFDLCVSGATLSLLTDEPAHRSQLHHVKVFARVSPEHKELIVAVLKQAGFTTLMAGDGTNDVGALKQAHVGVALLNRPDGVPKQRRKRETEKLLPSSSSQSTPINTAKPPAKRKTTSPPTPSQSAAAMLQQMQEEENTLVQLGDASIAAPFTSRSSSVIPITHIIRQGRCTLVTTLQMYKILALNCLVSAYSLSVLYLDGIKLGDSQATAAGMMIAICFLFISRSQPLEKLSKERPQPNIFSVYIFASIMLQFAVHLACLIFTVSLAKDHLGEGYEIPKPDAEFTPNLVNSSVFLISCAMQVSTFAINYNGRPFMQSLFEHKPLLYSLSAVAGMTLFLASEMSPEWNTTFELVPFPNSTFRLTLMTTIIVDFVGAWSMEFISKLLFKRT